MAVFPVFFLCFALSYFLLFPVKKLAFFLGAVDFPDGTRHFHPRPTPLLGGIPIFFALCFALSAAPTALRVVLLSGGALTLALGITDDIFPLSPTLKLLGEMGISLLPPLFSLTPKTLLFFGESFPIPPTVGFLFAFLLPLLFMNGVNLTDGLDGLCATLLLPGAVLLSSPEGFALAGALLGFLPHNLEKNKIFLGDTGALFLGYTVAVLLLEENFSPFSLLLFALPLFELFSSFFRRLIRGRNPFFGDRGHFHHRLLGRGFSPGETLGILGFSGAFLAILGKILLLFENKL